MVATEASLLYFVLLQLCFVDHMYQYSLDSFTMFFLKALKTAPPSAVTAEVSSCMHIYVRWSFLFLICMYDWMYDVIIVVDLSFSAWRVCRAICVGRYSSGWSAVFSRSTSKRKIHAYHTYSKCVITNTKRTHRLIFLTQLTFGLMQQNIIGEECGFSAENLRSYKSITMFISVCIHG